jgi:hypothetical protein
MCGSCGDLIGRYTPYVAVGRDERSRFAKIRGPRRNLGDKIGSVPESIIKAEFADIMQPSHELLKDHKPQALQLIATKFPGRSDQWAAALFTLPPSGL